MTTQRLSAAETAARLGIKPETLYAYVSRGLLHRERGSAGSTFDPLEVEQFAEARRRPGSMNQPTTIKDGRPSAGPLMTIDTDIALIEDDALYYRGRSATELAVEADFETVCWDIWAGHADPAGRAAFRPLPGAVEAVRRTFSVLPSGALLTDRIRIAVPVIAALDPLRDELEPDSVARRTGAMIITLAATVGDDQDQFDHQDHPIAGRLAYGLIGDLDDHHAAPVVRCVNAALVLLVDHDLAASTLAARVAASARANPYAVVSCGLAALDSALHGNVSRLTYRMLASVRAGEPAREVVARAVAAGRGGVPGFGHRIYRAADPRAELIFDLLAELPDAEPAVAAARQVSDVVTAHSNSFRNVDLALATLALATGMPAEAGETIFAHARIAGWIGHALDEYSQPPLRLRPVGRYHGP